MNIGKGEVLIDKNTRRVVHIRDESYDRHIYLEYDSEDEIVGFNFMQGCGDMDYEVFKDNACFGDDAMFQEYLDFKENFKHSIEIDDEYGFINDFFWYYANVINC